MAVYLRWSVPGRFKEVHFIPIVREEDATKPRHGQSPEWAVVEGFSTQNHLRHALSVLYRTKFCGRPALPNNCDLIVTRERVLDYHTYEYQTRFRLWVRTTQWDNRAGFLAGILCGKSRLWDNKQRKLRRRKKRALLGRAAFNKAADKLAR